MSALEQKDYFQQILVLVLERALLEQGATSLCNSKSSGCSVGSEICRDILNSQSSDSKYANNDLMSALER